MFAIMNTIRDNQQFSKTVAIFETEEQANKKFEELVSNTYDDFGFPSEELDFSQTVNEKDGGCFVFVATEKSYRNAILEKGSDFGQYITKTEYQMGKFI